jgi:hypothetical protein
MDKYRKTENGKFYLQQTNQESGELEWKEITLVDSTEPKVKLEPNERILNKPTQNYYFEVCYPDYVTDSEYGDN